MGTSTAKSVHNVMMGGGRIVKVRRRRGMNRYRDGPNRVWNCGCWLIWKQRNENIFRGKILPPDKLQDRIVQEAMLMLWRQTLLTEHVKELK